MSTQTPQHAPPTGQAFAEAAAATIADTIDKHIADVAAIAALAEQAANLDQTFAMRIVGRTRLATGGASFALSWDGENPVFFHVGTVNLTPEELGAGVIPAAAKVTQRALLLTQRPTR